MVGSRPPRLLTKKRRYAEVSVELLAALVSSAGTIGILKLILAGIADAVCIRRPVAHTNEAKMPPIFSLTRDGVNR
jgi:hypothetical protein